MGGVRITDTDKTYLRGKLPEFVAAMGGPRIPEGGGSCCCPNPAHEDKNASAKYRANSCTVHCYKCEPDKAWDVFEIAKMHGANGFIEAARMVSDAIGYSLGQIDVLEVKHPNAVKLRPKWNIPPSTANYADIGDAVRRAHRVLLEGREPGPSNARAYVNDTRGFQGYQAIEKYGLGWVLKPSDVMPEFGNYYGCGGGFLVIPFFECDGTTCRYIRLRAVGTPDMMRKFLDNQRNRKESAPKGLTQPVWGEWKLTQGLDVLYVVEGAFDAMACEVLTGRQAIALNGVGHTRMCAITYYTERKKRPKKVLIAPDRDVSGKGMEAAEKLFGNLLEIGQPAQIIPPYPRGAKDFNELLALES